MEQLRTEYLVLMDKWATFKRNGSAPPPAEYLKDRNRMHVLAAELDRLIED